MEEHKRRHPDLKLETEHNAQVGQIPWRENALDDGHNRRPAAKPSLPSEETIRATPPIAIPVANENAMTVEVPAEEDSAVDYFLRHRNPSVSFNEEVKLDSGHRQSMQEPLDKPVKNRSRGRSLLQALNDERTRAARAHSESDRSHYHPMTGRHLPKFSNSPPRERAQVGEQRFPFLQSTVDAMARESQPDLPNMMSLTSDSTISPTDEPIRTPRDEPTDFRLSSESPFSYQQAASYEEPKAFHRTASQRWREGERSLDFFTKATSGKSSTEHARVGRRPTSGSIRSPQSAASSFLRAFSTGSGGDDPEENVPCDAEGQTIGDKYVLGKQIGFGGFSVIKEVTLMQEDGRQRKLAAKIVRRHIEGKSESENDQAQAEFEHEVELWRLLHHPRILCLEAVYRTDEATFCFIPLNTGGTLFDLVRQHRQGLPLEMAKRHTYQLASAIRYLHCDARVVHRDIKLENILVDFEADPAGNVRLCDFGMAEWLVHDNDYSNPPSPRFGDADRPPRKTMGPAESSSSAFAGGSLDYAAPEILRIAKSMESGNSERSIISPAVDIWAFGVCTYAIFAGSRPFSNAFQPRVVMSILAGEWDREELQTKGGAEALELVEGCLRMDESERWNINDVLASLCLRDVSDEGECQVAPVGSWRL